LKSGALYGSISTTAIVVVVVDVVEGIDTFSTLSSSKY
jgi:hypothetical protein